jgi:holo-[acyl-carrier protein] synthase
MSGVGLDLMDIGRLERALERRPRLAQRLFSERERAYSASRARPAQHLAARFCAKEAVAKALAVDVFRPGEIEIETGPSGEPRAALSGETARRAEELGVAVAISLTHTGSTAGAAAVAVAR